MQKIFNGPFKVNDVRFFFCVLFLPHFRLQNGIITVISGGTKSFRLLQFSWAETAVCVKQILTSHRRFERCQRPKTA